jgi:hypothetical protein
VVQQLTNEASRYFYRASEGVRGRQTVEILDGHTQPISSRSEDES